MPSIHVAIFKWKEGVARSQVVETLDLVRRVADRVDGVRAIYCGPNASKWSQGYTDAVVVIADSGDALERYRADELHRRAAALIDSMELDGIGVDFSDDHVP